ncbi:MAG: hypothetical protein A2X86_19425 [Bdellovibrionales bacterium GWA2_49_15]|nr:MAG: hypothetical protein A2X86_19425 [Bdellovibrionales bacterium GWA2_49_15]HAZ14401.1 uracil phosphoribosyltransferase [Bdellovibrionales bacterium]
MTIDSIYKNLNYGPSCLEHKYGDGVYLLKNPRAQTFLAKLCRPEVEQPLLNSLITKLYGILLGEVVSALFPREVVSWNTRMKQFVPQGVYHGEVLKQEAKVICVDLARAGILPTQFCFEELSLMLTPKNIRQDHFYIQRKINERHEVIGVDVSGSKIGGDQEDAWVLFPDPMGATGSSLSYAVGNYKQAIKGKARGYVAMHLIVTPEYIKRMKKDHPDVKIFALRLDRGLSEDSVLASTPGQFWDKERGLTDNHYIVPGAGGVGEILNNSFV